VRRLIAVASCLVPLAVTAGAAAATTRIAKPAKQVNIACTTSVGAMVAEDVLCQPRVGSGWRLAVKRFALGPCGPPVG
jgi:hypothetical protein